MSTLNDADVFIVERSGTQYKVRNDELSTLNATDLFVVERSGTLYKVEASDVDTGPTGSTSTPVTVLTPLNGAGLNDGQSIEPLSSSISSVAGSGSITAASPVITDTRVTDYSSNTAPDDATNYQSGSAENIYDSSHTPTKTSNMIFADPGGNWQAKLVTTFNPPLQVNSSLKIMVYKANSYGYYYTLNGGADTSQTALRDTGTSVTDGIWEIRDPVNTSDAFTGELTSFSWGLDTGIAGAGNTYWSAIYVDGVRITEGNTVLTFASDDNVTSFNAGNSVTQNSGHTPTTTAITGTSTNATATTAIPSQATSSEVKYVDPTQVFHVDTSVNGWSITVSSITGTTAQDSYFWWSNDKVNWTRHYSRTISLLPYTLTSSQVSPSYKYFTVGVNSSSYETGATVTVSGDAVRGGETVLTLTDNTDLENFRVGDTVSVGGTAQGHVDAIGTNTLTVYGGTYSNGNTVSGPAFSAATGTVVSRGEESIELSSVSGRWMSNANKTATKSLSYDTALTFANSNNLLDMIGTAKQVNADGTDYNSATTSAITSVTGGGQVTISNCSESISAGGGAYQTGDMFGSTETTTYTRPNGSSYYSISGPDNVLTVNAGETIGVRGNGASQTTTAYMRIGSTTVTIGTLSSGLWSNINAYSQATTTSPVSGKIDRVWVESNDSNGDAGISRIIVNNQIVINGNTLNRSADLDLTDNTNLSLFAAGQVVQYGTAYSASAGNRDISGGMFTAFPGRYGDFNASAAAVTFDVTLASPTTARYIGHSMILGNYSATSNENTSIISITKLNGSTVSHSGSGSWSQLSNGYGIAHIDLGSSQSISSFTLRVDTTVSSNYYVGEGIYLGGSSTNTSSKIISTVPNAEVISVDTNNNSILTNGGTWNTGDTVTAYFDAATIGSVDYVSGSTLYGSNVSGTFIAGKYLEGATITAEAPSPSEIVFTTSNAGTTAYSGTNSTLSSRTWKLESGASSSGPWTLVGNYIDTGVASSQDGATQWASAPTLNANTFYRVGVTYVGSNADDVVSSNNIFKTGDA